MEQESCSLVFSDLSVLIALCTTSLSSTTFSKCYFLGKSLVGVVLFAVLDTKKLFRIPDSDAPG